MAAPSVTLLPGDLIDTVSALRKLLASVNFAPLNPPVLPTLGGNQSNAAQLNYGVTPILSPEDGYDTVQLPPAIAPAYVNIVAVGPSGGGTGNPIAVWAAYNTDDSINGIPNASDYFDFGSGSFQREADFFCFTDGQWLTQLTAD